VWAQADNLLANRHVPGRSDELGDRVVILDERGSPSLELLRFHRTLTIIPGFEVSLRRRLERLRQFKHPAFATTPAVEYLGEDRGLALLSTYTIGRRLSDLLDSARGGVFAAALIRQLTPALAAFHQYGDGIGHGALTASRIVVSPSGQLVIIEHALGSALERLQLTAGRMHEALGIPVPAAGAAVRPHIDARTDYFQLGVIALSLLLGRPVTAGESRENLDAVCHRAFSAANLESAEEWRGLRSWLERALQLNGRAFPSSKDATDAIRDVGDPATDPAQPWRALLEARQDRSNPPVELLPTTKHEAPAPPLETPVPVEHMPESLEFDDKGDKGETGHDLDRIPPAPDTSIEPDQPWKSSMPNSVPPVFVKPAVSVKPATYLHWAVALLALVAIAEAIAIAMLLRNRPVVPPPPTLTAVNLDTPDPGATVLINGQSAGVTPLQLKIGPDTKSISVASLLPPVPKQDGVVGSTGQQPRPIETGRGTAVSPRPASIAATPQPFGGIRLSSPIDLEVFEGDSRLGSSATGIVSAAAGRHELDLVNSLLGFRSRQVVDIKAGQVVPLTVTPPNGRININAVPWAEVLIDGKSVGETPIGNLSIPLGEHEIILRHPQLGEIRRTALVRSDVITRVTANLER
jgi:PEGA domain